MYEQLTHAVGSEEVTVIEPSRGWKLPDLKELWRYRDLLYFLSRREIVVRHQQAVVGILWAVLQPVFYAGLFALFFDVLQKIKFDLPLPYGLFAVSGLVLWLAFAKTIDTCTQSAVTYEPLITKIYLPRITLPLTTIAVPILDLVVGIVVVLIYAFASGVFPDARILVLPLICALTLALAIGFGLWLSALNVKYRDFGLLVPNLMFAGLFVSPITYDFSLIQDTMPLFVQKLYILNPMCGLLEAFRWSMLGTPMPEFWPYMLAVSMIATPILLVTGALYYERASHTFADVI